MTNVEKAIRDAESAGWVSSLPSVVAQTADDAKAALHGDIATRILWDRFFPLAACDPEFWQALMRAKNPEAGPLTIRAKAKEKAVALVSFIHDGGNDESFFATL